MSCTAYTLSSRLRVCSGAFKGCVRACITVHLARDVRVPACFVRVRAECSLVRRLSHPSGSFSSLDAYRAALQDDATAPIAKTSAGASAITAADKGTKRKAEKQGSRGVEKLKKANTAGMAKLSSFFQKK